MSLKIPAVLASLTLIPGALFLATTLGVKQVVKPILKNYFEPKTESDRNKNSQENEKFANRIGTGIGALAGLGVVQLTSLVLSRFITNQKLF